MGQGIFFIQKDIKKSKIAILSSFYWRIQKKIQKKNFSAWWRTWPFLKKKFFTGSGEKGAQIEAHVSLIIFIYSLNSKCLLEKK